MPQAAVSPRSALSQTPDQMLPTPRTERSPPLRLGATERTLGERGGPVRTA